MIKRTHDKNEYFTVGYFPVSDIDLINLHAFLEKKGKFEDVNEVFFYLGMLDMTICRLVDNFFEKKKDSD